MRVLMWLTIGTVAAAAGAAYLVSAQMLPVLAFGMLAAGLVLLLAAMVCRPCAVAGTAFLGAAAMLLLILVFRTAYLEPISRHHEKTQSLTITLTRYSAASEYGTSVEGYTRLDGKLYRVLAYCDALPQLKPGDSVTGTFLLRGTVDDPDRRYQAGNGIFLLASGRGPTYYRMTPRLPWYGYPAFWAASIGELLGRMFPADTLGFARALLLGDTALIDYETDTAFKLSGIRHVIAVSGLHVSILFSLVYALTGRRRVLSALLGLPMLVIFAAIAGFTPSITRACIMHGLMVLATLFEREYDPPTALSFALLLMLLVNPYCVMSVSLQLSAGCLCGIFLFSGRIYSWLMDSRRLGKLPLGKRKVAGWLSSSVSVTLGPTLTTTPLSALYFGTVSLVSPLTNLLTLWIVTFIFYGIMACCLLGWLWLPLGRVGAMVVSLAIRYVLAVSKFLSRVPLSAVYTVSGYIVVFLVFAYALLAVFLAMRRKQPVLLCCLLVLSLLLAVGASWVEPMLDNVRMTVLDVGQGQSILLQSEGRAFLVDCGGDSDTKSADRAAEMLLSMGISRLDGIILTHYDRDHAGGVAYLLTRVETQTLFLPDCADSEGYAAALLARPEAVVITDDTVLRCGDAELTLVASEFGITDNQSGLCVLFQRENCAILITGDRDTLGEQELMSRIALSRLDVLIVGHHGSRYSTGEQLLQTGQPTLAIISVGDNRYGHPTQEVLDRLADIGCEVLRTDQLGTIVYRR